MTGNEVFIKEEIDQEYNKNPLEIREIFSGTSNVFEASEFNLKTENTMEVLMDDIKLEYQEEEYIFENQINVEIFSCNICGDQFKSLEKIEKHMESVHSRENYIEGNDVLGSLKTEGTFENHTKEKKQYQCYKCEKYYKSFNNIKLHLKHIHSEKKLVVCNICNKLVSPGNLKNHKKRHSFLKPFQCNFCTKSFKFSSDLKRHHEKIHVTEKPHKCDMVMCDKSFVSTSLLKRHQQVHTNQRPHGCNACQKAFKSLAELRRHEPMHSKTKPFKCDRCPKSYTTRYRLNEHLHLRHETPADFEETSHQCGICKRIFTTEHQLKAHKLAKSDIKPHKCCVCQRTFRKYNNLGRHGRIHTNQKIFKCNACEKSYHTADILKTHYKQTHSLIINDKIHKCEICQKLFKTINGLKAHKNRHSNLKSITKNADNVNKIVKLEPNENQIDINSSNSKLNEIQIKSELEFEDYKIVEIKKFDVN